MIKVTRMEWDSLFWEINFYNVNADYDFNKYKLEINKDLYSSPYIIQALARDNDIEYINLLEDAGFRFVECKVNLIKRVQGTNANFERDKFKNVKYEDLKEYKNEFYKLYAAVSRFTYSTEEKMNEFYYKWVVESIKGALDDNCVGYYTKDVLEGFITYKIKEKMITIGLMGVFPDYQGKNISQNLLCYIDSIAIINKCNEIHVSTQGKNIKAINSYIKNGFIINNLNHWYYLMEGI